MRRSGEILMLIAVPTTADCTSSRSAPARRSHRFVRALSFTILTLLTLTATSTPAAVPIATAAEATDSSQDLGRYLTKLFQHLLTHLDLSANTSQQIKDVLEAAKSDVDDLVAQDSSARAQLRQSCESKTVDESKVRSAVESLAAIEESLAEKRAGVMAQVESLLTADQRIRIIRVDALLDRQILARERVAAFPTPLLGKLTFDDATKSTVDEIG